MANFLTIRKLDKIFIKKRSGNSNRYYASWMLLPKVLFIVVDFILLLISKLLLISYCCWFHIVVDFILLLISYCCRFPIVADFILLLISYCCWFHIVVHFILSIIYVDFNFEFLIFNSVLVDVGYDRLFSLWYTYVVVQNIKNKLSSIFNNI